MKYTRGYFFLGMLCLLGVWRPLSAQSISAVPGNEFVSSGVPRAETSDFDGPVLTIRKRVDEVNVLFIATNKHGKFVRDLNQNDFSILDDHKPPQSIVNFSHQTDLPLALGLLIDTSGSVRTRFGFEQEAAISFLQQAIRPNFDQAFVTGFNGHSTLTQDFTSNPALLAAGVERLTAECDELRKQADARAAADAELFFRALCNVFSIEPVGARAWTVDQP